MELKRLVLEGYKGFKNRQEIVFPEDRKPLVFVGMNGAGKTALLEAIRLGCDAFAAALFDSESEGLTINQLSYIAQEVQSSIHIDKEEASIKLSWSYPIEEPSTLFFVQTDLRNGPTLSEGYRRSQLAGNFWELPKRILTNLNERRKDYSLSLAVYYPSERLIGKGDDYDFELDYFNRNQLMAFKGALERSINFQQFLDWFKEQEDLENELRISSKDDYRDRALEAVRQAIASVLDDFSSVRIQRHPYVDMVVKKGEQKLSLKQLSSGEKALLTLAGDLAMRLSLANPGLKQPLEGRGVVMIDEIDLHLHPRWQVDVIGRLRKTFPNIQFIFTTHSPLIINRLPPESLYYLDNNECYPATSMEEITYGADIDRILAWQGVKDVLPRDIVDKMDEISLLIKDNALEKAHIELQQLKQRMNSAHPTLADLEMDLEFKQSENEMD
ncbi:AAA family ATPase [Saprospira grandis]|uniref:SMC domain-containing protein n=1 Tax=Saprospira grandis (strain Lewin) TaxID=984262 RepID=H6L719_SAPGL|nr:AAA family ATPase [Saprospira grandis]AFC26610.1 SMC domain-containing protein [Saprospira grandis str. Lewin]